MRLYDCAGDNSTLNLLNIYWTGVSAIILVYSIDSNQSFDRLQNWIDAMNKTKGPDEVVNIAIVASKSDLQAARTVPSAQGFQLKDTICSNIDSTVKTPNKCFMFKETSAQFDTVSVDECFQQIARHCCENSLYTEQLGLRSSMA